MVDGYTFLNFKTVYLGDEYALQKYVYILRCFTLCMKGNLSSLSFAVGKLKKMQPCQMVLIQIRADVLSVLIWVQLFARGVSRRDKNRH